MAGTAAQDWRTGATPDMLRRRAALLGASRAFFADRGVLEVDTPIVVNAPVSDVHIHSAHVTFTDGAGRSVQRCYLHTSPEYAMKRLIAAGLGDIYQICHVVRGLERGRLHNAEFTLIEWYRMGWSLEALIDEVEALTRTLLGPRAAALASERLSYRDAFRQHLGIDPFDAPRERLAAAAHAAGFTGGESADRDELLELLMSVRIGPALGRGALTFVHGYPASQAALARVDPTDPRAAQRFELYLSGIELANGFHELADVREQRARFEQDQQARQRRGLEIAPLDERLLAALSAGLPDCSGVALGFDRLVMLAVDAVRIDEVIPFPIERA